MIYVTVGHCESQLHILCRPPAATVKDPDHSGRLLPQSEQRLVCTSQVCVAGGLSRALLVVSLQE